MFRDSLSRQLKCNLDGAIFEDSCQVGVGGVIRIEVGAIVHAFSQVFIGCFMPAEVEALAVCEALHQILQLQSSNTMLEMDCKEVVIACSSSKTNVSEFGCLIKECKSLLSLGANLK